MRSNCCCTFARSEGAASASIFGSAFCSRRNEEFRLKIDGIGKKLAQLFHLRRVLGMQKFGARIPRTWSVAGSQKQRWQFRAATRDKADELWKTFFERSALALWIPDEMANAERSEVFAFIPRSEAGDRFHCIRFARFFSRS